MGDSVSDDDVLFGFGFSLAVQFMGGGKPIFENACPHNTSPNCKDPFPIDKGFTKFRAF